MLYYHVKVTDGYVYREVVGTHEQIADLADNPRPETVVNHFGETEAESWKQAMQQFGFTPGDKFRLGR